jgi:hypothetical protein
MRVGRSCCFDEAIVAKARAFRVYCIEARTFGEDFDWTWR